MSSDLLALLLHLMEEERAIPLHVWVRTDDEIIALRNQVADLTGKVDQLQRDFNRVEYLFRCESILNNRLIDLCRESGIKLEPSFFKRPY